MGKFNIGQVRYINTTWYFINSIGDYSTPMGISKKLKISYKNLIDIFEKHDGFWRNGEYYFKTKDKIDNVIEELYGIYVLNKLTGE